MPKRGLKGQNPLVGDFLQDRPTASKIPQRRKKAPQTKGQAQAARASPRANLARISSPPAPPARPGPPPAPPLTHVAPNPLPRPLLLRRAPHLLPLGSKAHDICHWGKLQTFWAERGKPADASWSAQVEVLSWLKTLASWNDASKFLKPQKPLFDNGTGGILGPADKHQGKM